MEIPSSIFENMNGNTIMNMRVRFFPISVSSNSMRKVSDYLLVFWMVVYITSFEKVSRKSWRKLKQAAAIPFFEGMTII